MTMSKVHARTMNRLARMTASLILVIAPNASVLADSADRYAIRSHQNVENIWRLPAIGRRLKTLWVLGKKARSRTNTKDVPTGFGPFFFDRTVVVL
ncbi:hypothetical protein TELCIR_14564 [Teladorsagia circumcincta]|uniref:Uncharacterized protein n=1 Tax=Teladorsagia circumcincta TaxID=45464 RepID=A0A2G9U0R1_TELCI|nr:hypothetical protein TELCIR_14564 [Teladorsagia circumcincta]